MRRFVSPELTFAVMFAVVSQAAIAAEKPVDYRTQIKPLLTKHCIACHGAKKQQSGLRVDTAAAAVKGGDRGPAIIPGKSDKSLIYLALFGKADITRMPEEKPPLSKSDSDLIKRWIDEGAKHPADEQPQKSVATDHWSFRPVRRPALPAVKNRGWIRNPIDAFVLARLERERLQPSPPADRNTLIRRVSLDLRGVPPTRAEWLRFRNDTAPDAYERMVDQMLTSPQYGERWGRHWLDVARYADSNGFTIDGPRNIWKYRDWVIRAINADMPFDRFTTEQLAGDLLPNATTDQIIATGFHRNTLINQEGGTDKEQFRVDAVADRIDTTGAAFLGLTVGCARCHAHKFDPISQRDYYELFAIFNNCDEPTIRVPSSEQTAELKRVTAALAAAEKPLAAHDRKFLKGLPAWEARIRQQATVKSKSAYTALEPGKLSSKRGTLLEALPDRSIFVDFSHPPNDTYIVELTPSSQRLTAIRLEALTHKSLPKKGPGYAANGNFVLTEFELWIQPKDTTAKPRKVPLTRAVADHSQTGFSVSAAIDGKKTTGWAINVRSGSPNVNREATFFPAKPIDLTDGSKLIVKLSHDINRNYMIGHFRISTSDAPAELLAVPASLRKIVMTPEKKRTKAQRSQLQAAFLQTDLARRPLVEKVAALTKQKETLSKAIPTTMVLRRRKTPRESHIHIRGDFLRKGARVQGDVPAFLPALPKKKSPPTRLDFARWLTGPDNPLTARVTVNRTWQRFFGLGLVETENDFGTQGIEPTHPKLLDWLAAELSQNGTPRSWSMKSLHRLIVTSATYRQSSRIRMELLKRDPRNRLLARQSRLRLDAEVIRDSALSVAGLISSKMLGPGVFPPQPKGIYVVTQQKKNWPEETGANRFRRGMYTYFWRSSPYPFLPTFDAPDANTTCTRRSRSNTPLQALTLANDAAFVEMAQGFSSRLMQEPLKDDTDRIRYAFESALSRPPSDFVTKALQRFLQTQRYRYGKDNEAAKAAAPSKRPQGIPVDEAAAWTAVARVLMNVDEFITRE